MLRNIRVRNYRAFSAAQYPIRPVTLFLGSNSVGKTSALQLPLLLKQTAAGAYHGHPSALRINGRTVSFGDVQNLFHRQNINDPIEISFTLVDSALHNFLSRSLLAEFRETLSSIVRYGMYLAQRTGNELAIDERLAMRLLKSLDGTSRSFLQNTDAFIDDYMSLKDKFAAFPEIDQQQVPLFSNPRYSDYSARARSSAGTISVKNISKADLQRCITFLRATGNIVGRSFEITFQFARQSSDTQQLRVSQMAIGCRIQDTGSNLVTVDIDGPKSVRVSSSILPPSEMNSYSKSLAESVVTDADLFSFVNRSAASRYMFPEMIRRILLFTTDTLHKLFDGDSVRHIGPLRAHPKRFYFSDVTQSPADGNSLIDNIRENPGIKKNVNEWLKRFGVSINVNQIQEIIHRLSIKSDFNSFDLDITDVGFGISQILPIIVDGYLSRPETIIVVEQPEIHLHPKMQGDLADLFIAMSGARAPGKQVGDATRRYFLIETHSEYLLSRLRRRIAEGAVSHEDIAVVIAERDMAGSTVLDNVGISETGTFHWPDGFQEASMEDTIAYAAAIAKRQKSAKS